MVSGMDITVWIFSKAYDIYNCYLKSLHEIVELLVDVAQIIQSLDAVCLHSDGLEVVLLGPPEIVLHVKAVPLIDESSGIVTVVVDGNVHIFFSIIVVSF